MTSESSSEPPAGGLSVVIQYARFLLLPVIFSSILWWICLYPTPVLPRFPGVTSWKQKTSNTYEKHLVPDTLFDAFKLGQISTKMKNFPSADLSPLVHEANTILNNRDMLTIEDVVDERLDTTIEEYCKRMAKYRNLLSFANIISIIAITGMLATLWPTLKVIYEACHLDVLWHKLISIATWVLKVIDPLISLLTFSIPLLVADQALHFPANSGARSQICILAGGLAIMAFFYRTSKAPTDFVGRGYFEAVSFSWGFSCLVPLALIGASRFLGFFAVGCVFGAMGFVAFPMPSGWAAGFQDEG